MRTDKLARNYNSVLSDLEALINMCMLSSSRARAISR